MPSIRGAPAAREKAWSANARAGIANSTDRRCIREVRTGAACCILPCQDSCRAYPLSTHRSNTVDTGPAPWDRGFLAIEPYAGITDSMNLAQKGIYKDLQTIAPGGRWEESFWVTPSGY